jgi:neurocan core protein
VLVRNDVDWSEPNDYFVFTTSEALEVNRETSVAAAHMSFLGVGAVIGVVIVVLFILLAIIDVSCYFVNGCGVTSIICSKVRGHKSSASDKEKEMEQGEGGEQVVKSQSPQYETVSIPVAQTATETEQTKLPESPAVSDNQDENKPLLPASQDVADSEPTEVTKDNIESPKEPLNLLSAEDRDNEAKGAIEEVGLTDNPKQPLNYQTEGKPDA